MENTDARIVIHVPQHYYPTEEQEPQAWMLWDSGAQTGSGDVPLAVLQKSVEPVPNILGKPCKTPSPSK